MQTKPSEKSPLPGPMNGTMRKAASDEAAFRGSRRSGIFYALELFADELLAVLDKKTLSVAVDANTHQVVDRSVRILSNCYRLNT